MRNRASTTALGTRVFLSLASVLAVATIAAPSADAHFVLQKPDSWAQQDQLGNPQKLGPCGDDGAVPTNMVTAYNEGDTVTITVDETIFHPGHYRVALAVHDRSELPAEPPVTPNNTPCGTVPIMDPPVFPVLADGALAHTSPFNGPQSIQVKLPPGVTCTHCTLQVIEFMSNHGLNNPGGCFYHHCADISITGAGGSGAGGSGAGGATTSSTSSTTSSTTGATTSSSTSASGSTSSGATTGAGGSSSGGTTSSKGGCGCSLPGEPSPAYAELGVLVALVAFGARRRRRTIAR